MLFSKATNSTRKGQKNVYAMLEDPTVLEDLSDAPMKRILVFSDVASKTHLESSSVMVPLGSASTLLPQNFSFG